MPNLQSNNRLCKIRCKYDQYHRGKQIQFYHCIFGPGMTLARLIETSRPTVILQSHIGTGSEFV